MTITKNNFNDQSPVINKMVADKPALKNGVEFTRKNLSLYDKSDGIKKMIDKTIDALNRVAAKEAKNDTPPPPKPPAKKKATTASKKRTSSKKNTAKTPTPAPRYGTHHRSLPLELTYIKRYMSWEKKGFTKRDAKNLLAKIQSDNDKGLFSVKTGDYGKEIKYLYNELHTIANSNASDNTTYQIDKKDEKMLKKFVVALEQNHQDENVKLITSFVNLFKSKVQTKDKAKRLLTRITNAEKKGKILPDDDFATDIRRVKTSLRNYIKPGAKQLEMPSGDLRGLQGIAGFLKKKKSSVNGLAGIGSGVTTMLTNALTTGAGIYAGNKLLEKSNEKKIQTNAGIMNSEQLANMKFETIGMQEPYLSLVGDPSKNFKMLVYGPPKHGKSTFSLMFCNHLAKYHGKTLYVGIEEKFGYTLSEKLNRLGARNENLDISESIPAKLADYDFICIDSTSRAGMDTDDIVALIEKYPSKAFVFVTHSTKEGSHRGGQDLLHEVDVYVNVVEGVATATGRFNSTGTMKVLEWETVADDQEEKTVV